MKNNKFYVRITGSIEYKTTFEELNNLNHFEVAFLNMSHAKNMVHDGRSFICEDSPLKPKAATLALYEICNKPEFVEDLKKEILNKVMYKAEEMDEYENCIVDEDEVLEEELFEKEDESLD